MIFFWTNIFPALLAGGLAGQVVTMFGGNWLTQKREYWRWILSERHKLAVVLLNSATRVPTSKSLRDEWTYEIRAHSQNLHLLYPDGMAPDSLADAVEQVFQLARDLKEDNVTEEWSTAQRNAVRIMRKELAKAISTRR